jgi:4-hydroxybenzoate polyprenyltransferase
MLNQLGQFLSDHMFAGAFVLFLVFVVIQKADKLIDHWIDSDNDTLTERHRERERIQRIRAGLES